MSHQPLAARHARSLPDLGPVCPVHPESMAAPHDSAVCLQNAAPDARQLPTAAAARTSTAFARMWAASAPTAAHLLVAVLGRRPVALGRPYAVRAHGRFVNGGDLRLKQHQACARQRPSPHSATEPHVHSHDQIQYAAANHRDPAPTRLRAAQSAPQPAAVDCHRQNPGAAHASHHATTCNHQPVSSVDQHPRLHRRQDACKAGALHRRRRNVDRDPDADNPANADRGHSTRADTSRYRCWPQTRN